VVILRQAVRLRPQAAEAHNNLGLALNALGRFSEAEACFLEALRLQPGYVEGHNNLGSVYKDQGRLAEALASYQVALWHAPRSASTGYNRSLALLANGDWEEGWREYEWRWQRKQTPPRPFRQPRWDGSALEGKTILLWSEQGLGDTIQFVRYAELVKERGGRVVLECPGCLVPLFRTLKGVDELVAEGAVAGLRRAGAADEPAGVAGHDGGECAGAGAVLAGRAGTSGKVAEKAGRGGWVQARCGVAGQPEVPVGLLAVVSAPVSGGAGAGGRGAAGQFAEGVWERAGGAGEGAV
jgi:hypothetical protein